MRTPQHHRRRFLPGIVLHRNKLWISELYGYAILLGLLAALFSISLFVVLNASRIHRNEIAISRLKIERLKATRQIADFVEMNRLAVTLREFTRDRIPSSIIGTLVKHVYESSKQFGYDPLLVLAVINVESMFDPKAFGRYRSGALSGALGLMQLKLETAREVANDLGMKLDDPKDILKPEVNVVIGVAYLTRLIAQFRSFKLGVLAYNQGPGVIIQSLSEKRPLSIDYYNRVLRNYYKLRETTRKMQDQGPTS